MQSMHSARKLGTSSNISVQILWTTTDFIATLVERIFHATKKAPYTYILYNAFFLMTSKFYHSVCAN